MTEKKYGYVNSHYLEAAAALFRPVKKHSYLLLGDIDGKSVIDIGCGSGVDTVEMAGLTGIGGSVVGVDYDNEMIEKANHYAAERKVNDRVKHHCGNACELPFSDNSFDAARSERLFMHLPKPAEALLEAIRITRPGGRVVVVDTDWGSLSANTGADDVESRIAQFRAREYLANGYSGRRLPGMFSSAPLRDITIETTALHVTDLPLWHLMTLSQNVAQVACEQGAVSESDVARWNDAMEKADKKGDFYGSVIIVTAAGTVV